MDWSLLIIHPNTEWWGARAIEGNCERGKEAKVEVPGSSSSLCCVGSCEWLDKV